MKIYRYMPKYSDDYNGDGDNVNNKYDDDNNDDDDDDDANNINKPQTNNLRVCIHFLSLFSKLY